MRELKNGRHKEQLKNLRNERMKSRNDEIHKYIKEDERTNERKK